MASTKSPKKKLKSVMPYIILMGIVLLIFGIGFLIGRLCIPTQAKDDTTQIINSTVSTTEETIVETEPPIEWLEFRVTAYCPCEKCCGKWATLRPKDENGQPIVYGATGIVLAGSPTSLNQFAKVLSSLACRHKYGLSATVHRADGLTKCIFMYLGNIAYKVPDSAVADKVMTVRINRRDTGVTIHKSCLDTDGTLVHAKLVNYLAGNTRRNFCIVNDLVENEEHFNLILSDRLEHLRWLMSALPDELQELCVMIDGNMTSKKAKAERQRAIDDMRSGKKRYLFASYRLAKEGLDIPRLDRLYLTTPQKDFAVIVQSVGRIARTFEGKTVPICYDYVDDIDYLENAYKQRCRHYRKSGCEILK